MEDRSKRSKRMDNETSLYGQSLLLRTVHIPMKDINEALFSCILEKLVGMYENKCLQEGFIKPKSIEIDSVSAGKIVRGNLVAFAVTFKCEVCFPVEGMRFSCKVTGITKSVIKGKSATENPSPVTVFISLEHQEPSDKINTLKEEDIVLVEVIGQRFSLNDDHVEIIAKLIL